MDLDVGAHYVPPKKCEPLLQNVNLTIALWVWPGRAARREFWLFSRGFHGFPLILMDFYGRTPIFFWISMDFQGRSCVSTDFDGFPGITVDVMDFRGFS